MRVTILLLLCVNILNAQSKYSLNVGNIKEKKYHTSFAFENIKGKMIIDVTINNKVRKFILDTGAPTSISDDLLSEINYKIIDNGNVVDANSKSAKLDVIQIPEFSISGLTFVNNYVLKITDTSFFECFNVDGTIGSNSLRNSVVDFDFKTNTITISNSFKSFGYPEIKANELFFKDFQSTPILKVKMKLGYLTFNNEVMFDSGDDSFYSIANNNYSKIVTHINEKRLPVELHNIKPFDLLGVIASSNGSFSLSLFGNADDNIYYKFKIQEFIFGATSFDNIIATTTYGSNSRIGSEILNYGKLTLDYKRKKYYFQAYDNQKKVNVNHKQYGFYPTFEDNKFIVGIVWDETLKDKIKVGDAILKVNNIDFNKLSKCEIMRMSFDDFKDMESLILTIKDKETNEIKVVEILN